MHEAPDRLTDDAPPDASHDARPDARGLRMAIAVSRYHRPITNSLCEAATTVFLNAGGEAWRLHTFPAAGAFELTAICRALAARTTRSGRNAFDAIVALGCIITGQTTHDQYIAQSVTEGLTAITLQTGIPIGFGVLTCQTIEQARSRASSPSDSPASANKGAEAMIAAIHSANTIRAIRLMKGLG